MNAVVRFWLIAVLAAGILIYLLAPVLTPFVVAALLAYLGDPLVDRLERLRIGRWRLGRTGGVIVVFFSLLLLLAVALLLLVPLLEKQISRLISQVPGYVEWLQEVAVPWLSDRLGITVPSLDSAQLTEMFKENWQGAGGIAAGIWSGVSKSGMALIGWLINLFLIPVVAFYLMRDWDRLIDRIRALIPRPAEPTVSRLARESDQVLGGFLRGQLLVMLALATIYSVGLTLAGVELALLIGVIAGLISFVPYLGTIVGVGMGAAASLFQVGELWHLVAVLAVFSVGQIAESVVLQPLLIGDRIGLHPVAVIFAVLAGGQLFGFLGILLALPVAAVLMVLLRYLHQRYENSVVYAGQESGENQVLMPGSVGVDARADDHQGGGSGQPSRADETQ